MAGLASHHGAAAVVLAAMLLGAPAAAHAQAAVRLFGAEPLPVTSAAGAPFSSWSLFLPCNPRWLAAERAEDLARLNRAYFHFAIVTGPRHAAAWFVKPRGGATPADQPSVVGDLDIERSAAYCDRFQLPPSGGPYVVVTTVHPDRWEAAPAGQPASDPLMVLALDGVPSTQAAELLTELNDQLQRNQLSREALDSKRYWLAWDRALTAMCRYFRDLKVGVSIKVLEIEKTSVCPA